MISSFRPILNLLFLVFTSSLLSAQNSALILGTIQGIKTVKSINLTVEEHYLNNSREVYTSEINEEGKFGMVIEIDRPQLLLLEYSRNRTLIYLEPNDTLIINTEASSFPFTLSFSGKGGGNNTVLHEYYRENPPELDVFQMVQYRSGIFWYNNTPRMDEMMLMQTPEEFKKAMLIQKEKAYSILNFPAQPGRIMSPDFKEFLSTEILYNYAYYMMLYGTIYKNKFQLTDEFFNFLDEVPLQNDFLSNYWYRQFLLAHTNHLHIREETHGQPYAEQFSIADKTLLDLPRSFVKSEMLIRAFKAKKFDEIMPSYNQYSKSEDYTAFEEKVVETYEKAIRYAVGSPAPEFLLADVNGEDHSLEAYKGKVIYLSFWASWCHPCLRKLDLIKGIQAEMEEKGVIFVNISVDKNKESWLRILEEKGLSGIQLLAPNGIDDEVVNAYQVKVLPKYFIIDQSGRFADKPDKFDPIVIRDLLLQKLNRAEN